MNNRNYQKELDEVIKRQTGEQKVPTLLLHCCCAPCSSYVLEYLTQYFKIIVFFYNPNIYPATEYQHRVDEIKRLVDEMPAKHRVEVVEGVFDTERYYSCVKGHEKDKEGGERCTLCFNLRLEEAAKVAKERGCDYFTTTLTISPLKDAHRLNAIGEQLAAQYGVPFLPSDFKKKGGYLRSIELSKIYDLYRQNYCGCVFSQRAQTD
ncbi:MAG: epoxyqueuosine reductase QueH [Paludibacteraceae bacterium]|nr:epoxyqueuosine reductase QueH [Paludibacteraceae bacterium]